MSDPSLQATLAGTPGQESPDITVPTQRGSGTGPQADGTPFAGRSPGRLAWMRLRRDRTAMVSGITLVVLVVLALLAPLIEPALRRRPAGAVPGRTARLAPACRSATPAASRGEHWFGLEPGLGRDIFIRHGLRPAHLAVHRVRGAAVLTAVIGVIAGHRRRLPRRLGRRGDRLDHRRRAGDAVPHLRARRDAHRSRCASTGRATRCPTWFRVAVLIGMFAAVRLDGHRPAGPRAGDLAARAGVRRGGPGQRRRARGTSCSGSCCRTSGRRSWSRSRWPSRRTSPARRRCPSSASACRSRRPTSAG